MGVSKRGKSYLRWHRLFWDGTACLGLVAATCILASGSTRAGGSWTANFSTLTSAAYNDNPSLATKDTKGRTDFTVNRAVDAEYAKDRYRVDIVGRANLVASKQEIAKSIFAADQIRYDLDVSGEYDFDTSVIAAAFGLGFDTVQNTEFDDAGQLTGNVTRTDGRLSLNYNRALSERWSLNASDNFTNTSYSGGNFTGYSNNAILVGLGNAYNDRLTLSPSIGYSRYTPDSGILKPSNTYRVQVSGNYELSENDSLGVTIGGLQTDGTVGWSALVNYSQEILDGLVLTANANRDNSPSSGGNIRQSTGFSGGVTYQLTEMTQIGFSSSWRISSQVGATSSGDTTQLQMDPSISWTLNEKWQAGLNLQNRRQKQPSTGTASSNSVTFALNYNLPLK